jgi:flagellar hook-associated protein 1 FlgK
MSTLFSSVNLALRALLTHQQSIQVTEHNVANVNTPGYRRQEAVLTAGLPYPSPQLTGSVFAGQMGTGVMVDLVRRFNMEFYDGRYRRELGETKRWSLEQQVLSQVESTLSETGEDSLVSKMDAFWSGWQALSNDPTNMALRADLKEKANNLVGALNWRANALIQLREDQDLAIQSRVDEINSISGQIAKLNAEIASVKGAGDQPNDLLDNRDQLLDRLAELSGATVNIQENGEANVTIGQHALVIGSRTFSLTTAPDAANFNLTKITWQEDGLDFDASRGELAGLLDARDRVIPARLDALDNVANTLATRVNQLHQTGYGLNNAHGLDFFDLTGPTTHHALNIRLSTNLDDLNNIAASTTTDSPGNGNLAGTIARVQEELLMSGNSASITQYYTGKVGEFGLEVSGAETRSRDRQTVVDSLSSMRESATGVSLDEEAANLVKSQRAYQAASRMMTAIDDMLDRVINGMGLVGR